MLAERLGQNLTKQIRNVKGSHIVVPSLFDHPYPYIFQNVDQRVVFAIPYEGEFTLIGTTDEDYTGDLGKVSITDEETRYLCQAVNRYFTTKVRPEDVVWSYAGVRPLFDDEAGQAHQATREYVLELDQAGSTPALLNVYGGKITTYRKLAEQAVDKLCVPLGVTAASWTDRATLAGRGHRERGLRAISDGAEGGLSLVAGGTRRALCAQLRHAHHQATRWRVKSRGSGRGPWWGTNRSRSQLSCGPGVRAERRGYPMAPIQARTSSPGRHSRAPGAIPHQNDIETGSDGCRAEDGESMMAKRVGARLGGDCREGGPLRERGPQYELPSAGHESTLEFDLLRNRDCHIHAFQSYGRMAWERR